MFRVPADPYRPSYAHTFTVTFGQWFRSSGRERNEWLRRRGLAKRNDQYYDPGQAPLNAPAVHAQIRQTRRAKRLVRTQKTLMGIELFFLLIPMLLCVGGVIVCGVWEIFYR